MGWITKQKNTHLPNCGTLRRVEYWKGPWGVCRHDFWSQHQSLKFEYRKQIHVWSCMYIYLSRWDLKCDHPSRFIVGRVIILFPAKLMDQILMVSCLNHTSCHNKNHYVASPTTNQASVRSYEPLPCSPSIRLVVGRVLTCSGRIIVRLFAAHPSKVTTKCLRTWSVSMPRCAGRIWWKPCRFLFFC